MKYIHVPVDNSSLIYQIEPEKLKMIKAFFKGQGIRTRIKPDGNLKVMSDNTTIMESCMEQLKGTTTLCNNTDRAERIANFQPYEGHPNNTSQPFVVTNDGGGGGDGDDNYTKTHQQTHQQTHHGDIVLNGDGDETSITIDHSPSVEEPVLLDNNNNNNNPGPPPSENHTVVSNEIAESRQALDDLTTESLSSNTSANKHRKRIKRTTSKESSAPVSAQSQQQFERFIETLTSEIGTLKNTISDMGSKLNSLAEKPKQPIPVSQSSSNQSNANNSQSSEPRGILRIHDNEVHEYTRSMNDSYGKSPGTFINTINKYKPRTFIS
jgi:hypothetical protein